MAALIIGLVAVAGFALVQYRRARVERAGAAALPVYGHLPSFDLRDQRAAPFSSASMKDKVWVANFIFTRCPTVCPLLTRLMKEVQRRAQLRKLPLRSVSFTVDPEHDTPETLARYAASQAIDTRTWSFVTGALEDIEAAVVDGFRTSMSRVSADAGELGNILHGDHFVLVDRDGQIRGYYSLSGDGAKIEQLLDDAALLLEGGGDFSGAAPAR